jgi:uncharacterized protein HemX
VRRAFAILTVVACLALAGPASAQDPATSSTTVAVATQDIIPRPNSGAVPQEAGDRGGALQLGVLALVLAGIGGAVLVLVRQSRHARAGE